MDNVTECVSVIQVKAELSKVDPYFEKLADGMKDWIAAWDMVQNTDISEPAADNGKQ